MKPQSDWAPRNVNDAIDKGLCIGPMAGIRKGTQASVRDFLAQKFQAAFDRAESEAELERLKQLWTALTGETVSKI